MSHRTQNEFITIVGTAIQQEVVKQVKDAKYFAVIADETTDAAHTEQLCFVVRYLREFRIEERLLAILKVDDTCAASLFDSLTSTLEQHGLDVSKLRGQCYDGAKNVSGDHTGLQRRVREISPSAIFTHCYAHCLNLVIVQSVSENLTARNFFGLLQNLYVFLESCSKRHAIYQRCQSESGINPPRTLKSLSDTRWTSRVSSIVTVECTLGSILAALDNIYATERKPGISSQAKGLRNSIDFEFVLSLKVRSPAKL